LCRDCFGSLWELRANAGYRLARGLASPRDGSPPAPGACDPSSNYLCPNWYSLSSSLASGAIFQVTLRRPVRHPERRSTRLWPRPHCHRTKHPWTPCSSILQELRLGFPERPGMLESKEARVCAGEGIRRFATGCGDPASACEQNPLRCLPKPDEGEAKRDGEHLNQPKQSRSRIQKRHAGQQHACWLRFSRPPHLKYVWKLTCKRRCCSARVVVPLVQ
jgi:hypothetical protein